MQGRRAMPERHGQVITLHRVFCWRHESAAKRAARQRSQASTTETGIGATRENRTDRLPPLLDILKPEKLSSHRTRRRRLVTKRQRELLRRPPAVPVCNSRRERDKASKACAQKHYEPSPYN
ncbi:hypothetical protein MTO96_040740 [Rhipicephalus appendiculatus]